MNASTIELVREFVYLEAALLDTWKLKEWADLFTEDGEYLVPPLAEPEGEPSKTLFLIYDDRIRLRERALRLLKQAAHAEFPRSKTTRLVSNVRITARKPHELHVESAFVVFRAREAKFDVLPGHCHYVLRLDDEEKIRIRSKRSMLSLDVLRPQDKLTIIV